MPDSTVNQRPGGESPDDDDWTDLFGTLDLTDLQGLLDAARESDAAAGDPVGEDAIAPAASDTERVLSQVELAGRVADGMKPGPGLGYWMASFKPGEMGDFALPG